MSREVIVRILGPVGVGKSAVYATLVNALSQIGVSVKHADEKAWTALENAGEVELSAETLNELTPVVTFEEVGIRTDAAASPNQIMQYFAYAHLPPHLQAVSKPFALLAQEMDQNLPNGPEKSTGLRKLLEAKDCMVRQLVAK
ncbi:hypothetical protein HOT49_gp026 [Erwinia phage vB_EamM_Alexandra]|uniref:Uncharacterized protein n=1 Tax=Erwinia phage vB_EamM_Alexandra TaxID=2201424 RepID=A0A2Z4QF13_9CAUD|nr:hypothetical protein HOT49_gp026 [Erwinia phage vB_EamM_Alexandra]AWY08306.1 hypothetical protein Alexandra_26 [Erwinia phage vB_EamM_Alexandra]